MDYDLIGGLMGACRFR